MSSLIKAKLKNKLVRARLGSRTLPAAAQENLTALDHLDPREPALSLRYVIVDLETTGLDVEKDRVVSVGAVRMVEGRVRLGERFVELVNPGRNIPVESIKIHGIKPDQVANARPANLVFEDFLAFLGKDILVAHYAPFDLHFINLTMTRLYGFPLQNPVLDTVRLCKSLVLPSDPYGINRYRTECSLDSLTARYNIKVPDRHTAFGDALATALIFQRMLSQMERNGSGQLKDLLRAALIT